MHCLGQKESFYPHRSLPPGVIQVLNGLHSERHAASGIDAMLHRLYGPILYRAFDASNASIRLNALNLLMDAFPISVRKGYRGSYDAGLGTPL
jgi:hypothetical protein